MKNRILLCILGAAAVGWGCCFGAMVLSAQEQPPREFQGDRERPPRPKSGPGQPGQSGQRPDRPGERQGPPDGNRSQEGGYPGRPNAGAMLTRMGGRILVVAPAAAPNVQQEVEEDMTTMLHLVERTIEKDLTTSSEDLNNYRNIPSVLSSDSRATYLDDYGMIFSLRTPYVLNGPANAERPVANPGPRGNQWERARQELFGDRAGGSGSGGGEGQRDFRSGPMQYDPARVSALKDSLLNLLRDASNMRHIKADQGITIILTGSPSFGMRPQPSPAGQPDETAREGSPLERFRSQLNRATYLVLRTKKSDIDAFAQGKLTADQFKAKVSIVNN